MELFLWCLGTGAASVVWSAWRLKGRWTWKQTAVAVLGGPRPTVPK